MTVRHFSGIVGFSSGVLMLLSSQAEAAGTLGDVITSVTQSFNNFPNILSAAAYLLGLFFAVAGIFKFKDHVDHPQQHHLSDGIKRFLAGGMMLSMPTMSSAVHNTLFPTSGPGMSGGGHHAASGGGGMDQMIVNFVSNIYTPATIMLTAFAYISAVVLLIVGITRLTKTAQEGPRGPAGLGTIVTFLTSGALFSFGDMMGTFSNSLFGSSKVLTNVSISPNIISGADSAPISAVIESLMAFIMIVGYIAFIRGWFVLKAFADGGHQNATLAQALTFLFGGAVAINMGTLVNVLQTTAGIGGGLTFN